MGGKKKRSNDDDEIHASVPSKASKNEPTPAAGDITDFGAFGSSESVKSELSMFDGHSYQVTHLKGQWLEILPINQYEGNSGCNILFKIPKSPGWYLDLRESYIIAQVGIQKADGDRYCRRVGCI